MIYQDDASARRTGAADLALLIVRVVVGVIFVAHGGQKLFGLWGGKGLAATVEGMGTPLGQLVSIGEFFGGLALIVGLFSRFSAFWIAVIMVGAIVRVHGKNGFFSSDGGYENNLALMAMALAVLIAGPGRLSLAHAMSKRKRPNPAFE